MISIPAKYKSFCNLRKGIILRNSLEHNASPPPSRRWSRHEGWRIHLRLVMTNWFSTNHELINRIGLVQSVKKTRGLQWRPSLQLDAQLRKLWKQSTRIRRPSNPPLTKPSTENKTSGKQVVEKNLLGCWLVWPSFFDRSSDASLRRSAPQGAPMGFGSVFLLRMGLVKDEFRGGLPD